MKKLTTSFFMASIFLLGFSSCDGSSTKETESKDTQNVESNTNVYDYDTASTALLNVEENYKKHSIMAGCKGNLCNFVELSATTNSKGHITSVTIDNVSSKPVDVRVEYQTLFSDIEPWSKYKIPANGSKTYPIDPYFQYMGASIKRANEITN